MSAVEYRFLEPLDVLFLRGNKLFGDPGSFGESLIPPWPSVAAGAIRSRMLADDRVDLSDFAAGKVEHPALGRPERPGSFAINAFYLAKRNQNQAIEILVAPPADLVISKTKNGALGINRLRPTTLDTALASSSALPLLPVLAQSERSKAASGYWLRQTGWQKYLNGETPAASDLQSSGELWTIDSRIGIGLDSGTRSVAEGKLFSSQAVALCRDVGFVVGIIGAQPPRDGLLRLGGDGRAAAIRDASISLPEPDYDAIGKAGRCRLVLTTPGLFPQGWKPPGTTEDNWIALGGIRARLACAAVPRAEVISGWDLANRQPKPAQRVAPTGSVYWLDQLEGSPEALRKLVKTGLWGETCEDQARRAEGFNQCTVAVY